MKALGVCVSGSRGALWNARRGIETVIQFAA
jgi:hypothetical protein